MSGVLKVSALNVSGSGNLGGICGFASTIGALFENGLLGESAKQSLDKSHLNTRVLATIVTYLRILKAENNQQYINEIVSFTQAFGGYETFSIDAYIKKIEDVVVAPKNIDKDFSIAMPPNPVADFIRRNGLKTVLVKGPTPALRSNVILGLGDGTKTDKWGGLKHWFYCNHSGTIYNYGNSYGSDQVTSKMAEYFPNTSWSVVYQLPLKK